MIAAAELPYTDDQRFADRDAALREVLTCTAGLVGLSHRGEADIRSAVMRHIEPILELADHATVARLGLEVIEGRMDRHVRGPDGHIGCSAEEPCIRFRVLQIRREKCWRAWAQAYRALLEGKRR